MSVLVLGAGRGCCELGVDAVETGCWCWCWAPGAGCARGGGRLLVLVPGARAGCQVPVL